MWDISTVEYYSAIKRNKLLLHATNESQKYPKWQIFKRLVIVGA